MSKKLSFKMAKNIVSKWPKNEVSKQSVCSGSET